MAGTDPFDDARPGWVKQDDLEGRLVLIKSIETGERESTMAGQQGRMYEYIVTDTIVLDGEETELMDSIPFKLEAFQWAGQRVTGTLKPKIRSGRMTLGRVAKVKVKGRSDAWELQEPTEGDKQTARDYLASVQNDAFN